MADINMASSGDEVARLEERLQRLAAEKSNLQLVNHMMQRLSAVSGLSNMVELILQILIDSIGGTNLILYYLIDQDLFFADVYGQHGSIKRCELEDQQAAEVLERHEAIEYGHEFNDTRMLTSHFTQAWTCLLPLMVGKELIGVLRMENLHVSSQSLQPQLSMFMNYCALMLKNEVLGYTQLQKAYSRLQQEISVRQASENELREIKESLEEKVIERTDALRQANQRLQIELAERQKIQAKLAQSETRYRSLFEDLPVSVWEEDFSAIKYYFDHLRAQGVEDLGEFLRQHDDVVAECARLVRIVDINDETLRMLGLSAKQDLNPNLGAYFVDESMATFRDEMIALAEGLQRFSGEVKVQLANGQLKQLFLQLRVVPGYEDSLGKVLLSFIDITARKMAEQALTRSEQHLRNAEELAKIGSWEANLINGTDYWSEQTYRIFDMDPATPVPSIFSGPELVHPDDRARVAAALQKGVEETGLLDFECRVPHKNGGIAWVDVHGITETGPDGTPIKIHGSILDITQRKLANEALRESETKLRAIFESSQDAIGVSKQGIHILANPAYIKLFGYSQEELVGQPIYALIAPGSREQVSKNVRDRAEKKPVPMTYETRGLRKDGSEFDLDVRVSPYELENEIYTLVILRDITDQKRAREALSQSEQLFRQLAENVQEVMWVRNYATRKIEYVNPAYERVWGRSCASLYEHNETFVDAIYPQDVEIINEAMVEQYQGRYLNVQMRVVRPDEDVRWVWVHSYPVFDSNGTIFRLVGIAEDITERKQQEELFEMEQRRLTSLLKISQARFQSMQQLVDAAIEEMKMLSDSQIGFIVYFDELRPGAKEVAISNQTWTDAQELLASKNFGMLSTQVMAQMLQDKKIRIVNDMEGMLEAGPHTSPGQLQMKRFMVVPIVRADQVAAIVGVGNRPSDYTARDASQLGMMMEEVVKIIERARAGELLQASLTEKNALLKEIHHRVKNNMQVMISLLQMQASLVEDERIRAMFYECRDRIYSMALVHEQLYGSTNLSQIRFGDYVERLVYDLHSTYNITTRIRLDMHINPVNLPIELAVPCGLMINEMVTNAFKHAFPGGRTGIVYANLYQEEDDIVLTIGDDGVGIADGIVPEKTESLGLKLIFLLARQVGGTLRLERENGTRFTLRFSLQF